MAQANYGAMVTICAGVGPLGYQGVAATGSTAWPTANKAFFHPIRVPVFFTPLQIFWGNGATANNNADAGIYTQDGTRLFSTTSTAQSGTTTLQAVAVSGITLSPGIYYLALALDGTTGTILRSASSLTLQRGIGTLQQTSAFPLPAAATFAALATTIHGVPLLGLSRKAVL